MKNIYIYIIFSFLLLSNQVYSENFRHLTINEGLSNNAIFSILQDSKGLMWFGSINGLHRYDGKKIVYIKQDSPFISSIIFDIKEDKYRTLWIGTDAGLLLYDMDKEKYRSFDKATNKGVRISSIVRGIYVDSKEQIWICTMGQGIFCYNREQDKLIQITSKNGLASNYVKHVIEDRLGTIWITLMEKGIVSYNPATKKLSPINVQSHLKGWYSFEDSQGKLWFGTDKGLYLLNKKTRELESVFKPFTPDGILEIKSIVEYHPKELLLATDEGLVVFNTEDYSHKVIRMDKNNIHFLNDNYLHALYIDKEKGLWIGTYFGGVNYLSPTSNNFSKFDNLQNSLPGKVISVIEKDSQDNLWMGTDEAGIFYLDCKTNKITSYKPSKNRNSFPSYKNIHAIMIDKDELYVGMYMGGLDIYNLKTKQLKHLTSTGAKNSLASSSVYSVFKDSEGIIWIGTTSGMNYYNPSNGQISSVDELAHIEIRQIIEDNNGNLWVTTPYDGLFRFNKKTSKWINYKNDINNPKSISSNNINTVVLDELNQIWIGTNGYGLCKYNSDSDNFTNFRLDKLPSSVIYSIIPDKDNLWLTTTNGLIMFNQYRRTYKVYNQCDGLSSNQFSPRSSIRLNDGTIIVGSINGFNGFKPSELNINSQPPVIVFTDFELFNKVMTPETKDSPLSESITYTKEITLKYNQSIFSIGFASLSYSKSYNNEYSYILEGFDKTWTTTKNTQVTYTNLAPGNYVFRVKASNGDGVWNNEGISLKIRILPPFWLSIPFLLFYFICITCAIFYVFYRINKKHKSKLALVKSEKEAELYNSKIEFFTNIIHEIRTPLTLILAPLEVIFSNKGNMSDILPQLKVIDRNGKRLLSLVNQLMDFRKIEEKGIEIHLKECNICQIIKNIYDNFRFSAEIKNINLDLILPEKDCYADLDEEAFTKIITNLLSNALKFTQNKIIIEIKEIDDFVEIDVVDNGIGISADEQKRVFDAFYQVKESLPQDYIGTGIGLLLVKKLTILLNGKLELVSDIGKGSKFTVKFKKKEIIGTEKSLDPNPEEGDTILTDNTESTDKRCLLIVDDNNDLLSYLQDYFKESFQVICAENGKEALDLLKTYKVDFIISDVMMPVMNGYELCNAIKKKINTSHIPVLLLTAKAADEDYIEGFESYADAYVEKPFSISVLKAHIESILHNRKRLQNEFEKEPLISMISVASSEKDKIFLNKLEKVIEEHILDPNFSVNDLANSLCMGRSSFFNKMKALYEMTPNDFIRIVRLKKAATMINEGEVSVNNLCYNVGFSSPSYFSKCFQQQFGMTPKEYINMVMSAKPKKTEQ